MLDSRGWAVAGDSLTEGGKVGIEGGIGIGRPGGTAIRKAEPTGHDIRVLVTRQA